MKEEWTAVPGWEGLYEVSDRGRVRSLDRVVPGRHGPTRYKGRILTPAGKKYPIVTLAETGAGRRVCRTIHSLVMEGFVGPCPEGLEVCHNDGDGWNNRLDNLRYDTRSENAKDTYRHGRRKLRGEKSPAAKLTEAAVKDIRNRINQESASSLGREYGVSPNAVLKAARGETWSHVS